MPWAPLPNGEPPEPRRVGEGLDRVAASLGVPDAAVLPAVFGGWEELVGARVAAHARPLSLRAGVLAVAVDEPAWATQLRFLEGDLLGRLAERVGSGKVARIEVRVVGP
jgi:predicted nucleic acid-binding Zn ribbon protein